MNVKAPENRLYPIALSTENYPILKDFIAKNPERMTRGSLLKLRESLILVMNALLKNRGRQNPLETIEMGMSDFNLGLEYIFEKKGMAGVEEYFTPQNTPKIIGIGKKLRETFLENLKKIEEENYAYSTKVFTTKIDDVRKALGNGLIDNLETYKAHQKLLEKVKKTLELRNVLRLNIIEIKERIEHIESPLREMIASRDLDDIAPDMNLESELGVLDLALFCEVFSSVHQLSKDSDVTLHDKDHEVFFQDLYPHLSAKQKTQDDIEKAYRDKCQQLFGDNWKSAWTLIMKYFERSREIIQIENLHDASKRKVQYYKYFPIRKIKKAVRATQIESLMVPQRENTIRTESIEKGPMKKPADEILGMSRGEFKTFIENEANTVQDWEIFLQEEKTAEKKAKVLSRIAKEASALFAGKIFMSFLSLDKDIPKINVPISSFFTKSGTLSKKLKSSKIQDFYERLDAFAKNGIKKSVSAFGKHDLENIRNELGGL